MIAELAHVAEWIFWIGLAAFLGVAGLSCCDAIRDWRSARVVRKPRPVVDFDQRRRAQLQSLLRDEQKKPHADEWQAIGIGVNESKREAALHLIMHGERR